MSSIVKLKTAIAELEDGNDLIPVDYKLNCLINACRTLLEENNYTVRSRPKNAKRVKNNQGLVFYYYTLLENYYKDLVPYRDYVLDLKIAKDLISKLQKDYNLNIQQSLDMAIRIIEMVFKYREEFSFKLEVIVSFKIFGQSSMSWVTEKAIKLINREQNDGTVLMRLADKETEKIEQDNNLKFGYDNLEELAKKY